MKKLWEITGQKVDPKIIRFTVGEDCRIDQILLPYDIKGSQAHAKALARKKLLSEKELESILRVLEEIARDHTAGRIQLTIHDEDMHTFIENTLVRKLGEAGKKIHTGRSRNDQVLTAIRLFLREKTGALIQESKKLAGALESFEKKYGTIAMAGYTHTRKAMPTTVGMWAQGFADSISDTRVVLEFVGKAIDQSPLGTGAGYGIPIDLDREAIAKELGFAKVQQNPIYVQNSRGKFEALLLSVLSQVMLDINKLASDLIFFSMPEFGIFQIPESFCTGSSIMPQKKNPDVLELLRARYHLVLGEEFKLKSLIGNLISGYHRDFQLTKEIIVCALEMTLESQEMMTLLISQLRVDKKKAKQSLTPELFATERVYQLVQKGTPFREAYLQVKKEIF